MLQNSKPILIVFLVLSQSNKIFSQSVTVEKETPLEVDAGLLMVTDLNPIDEESYK